ncbi:response regulator transcription factor [Sphingobium boeckii]|uniref:Two-component system OmpR family response regulator n=1 Tax=Sphingobium boeckii TaxID=1082345 RepID=A0A7W9AJY2_9SPHN|nr:response regulator transcription factor [Sphingobium boeckii]MBB5686953.1 two-component system OmpR family response regulator [Sphingobium boeckii]
MSHKILIVDDDPHIREILSFALGKAGMETREAADGEDALAAIARSRPDLVVLDINMPRMDGLEVCRRLRATGDLPVLFLSSRDDEIDRVVGIELGADDYVVKPFSPREVVARVNAILKRAGRTPAVTGSEGQVAHNRLSLDTEAWEARWGGDKVDVTATEFQLLLLLASLPAKVFSRDAIIDRLHGPGFAVTDRTIDSHIRNLRGKFVSMGGTDLIETRAGIGYRIGACVGAAD